MIDACQGRNSRIRLGAVGRFVKASVGGRRNRLFDLCRDL
jgi:hypothetical protein